MMAVTRIALLVALAVIAHQAAWAVEPLVVRHYQSTDGLPVSSVTGSRVGGGFLWLATHDGLVRFDGQEFKVYSIAGYPAMRNNRIVKIYRGGAGRTYALTVEGDLLRLGVDGVRRVELGDGAADSTVRAVQDEPLCVTTARGLFCEGNDGGFSPRLRFDEGFDVAAALPAGKGQAWLVVPGKGILLQTGRRRRVLFDDADLYTAPGLPPLALVDRDGSLVIALDRGLLRIARDGKSRWLLDEVKDPVRAVQLRQDPDGTLWIGTDEGIFSFDGRVLRLVRGVADGRGPQPSMSWRAPDGALWESVGGHLFRNGTLVLDSYGTIHEVSFDDAGTAWVSTLRDGIYALSQPRVDKLGLADGLLADNIYTVARDSEGTMWLGSLEGPVQAVEADGDIRHYGLESGLPGMNPWVVAVGPEDAVYVGTYAPGLFRKKRGSARFEKIALPGPLARARVLAIDFDRKKRLWLGTTKGAWRRDGASWHRIWPKDSDTDVHAILHGADGSAWYGTEHGLWRQHDGMVEAIAADAVDGVTVRGLQQDRDGAIWASTEGYGLVRIDVSASGAVRASRLGRAQGLPSDSPHAVLEDRRGNLWVNSNQGIFRIARKNLQGWLSGSIPALTPLTLGFADGVTELEGNGGLQPAAASDGQGRMWFPYQRGIVRVDPGRFYRKRKVCAPVIDGLEAGGITLTLGPISLPVGMHSVSIHYSAPDIHGGTDRFRYRLSPGDDRWVDVRDQRVVSLASLAPGTYRFELAVANSDGVWSAPATLAFTIPARWYEAPYFRLLVTACLVGLIVLFAWQRVRRTRRHADELSRQVEARTDELRIEKRQVEDALARLSESHRTIEKKNLLLAEQASRLEKVNDFRARLFADISHELRTPLMLASMPLKEMVGKAMYLPRADHRRLALSISQIDRLTLLVQQLLSLVQAEAGQLKLNIMSFDIHGLTKEVVDGFKVLNTKAGIRYEVRSDAAAVPIFADRDRLTTVLDNLLDNASKYAPADSVVGVRLSLDAAGEAVRITVSDAGPGFPPAVARNLFQRFFRGDSSPRSGRGGLGIGLAAARELVELHGGAIGAESEPGKGACFWITLPLGSAHVSLNEVAPEPTRAAVPLPATHGRLTGARRLLIVEDHPELANYLGHRLGEYCPVQVAGDAGSALAWLERKEFGMVIADVLLPDGSGIALCRTIKADRALSHLPVVLMSARAGPSFGKEGADAGADECLVKPFGFEALLEAVSRAWPDASLYFGSEDKIVSEETGAPLLAHALGTLSDPAFNVGQWARHACTSERQLRRKVIELTGQSPVAWLREQRLLRVRKLISHGTCRTLAEAGARVGLDNPPYLYRIYRARFGAAEDEARGR
jgi:signal transduction histidine kinase/ligand-binding sensor domain-containing protein/DNA-binding response OmpR family regulator